MFIVMYNIFVNLFLSYLNVEEEILWIFNLSINLRQKVIRQKLISGFLTTAPQIQLKSNFLIIIKLLL